MSKILKLTREEAANIIGTHAFVLGRLGIGLSDTLTVTFDEVVKEFTVKTGGEEPEIGVKTIDVLVDEYLNPKPSHRNKK